MIIENLSSNQSNDCSSIFILHLIWFSTCNAKITFSNALQHLFYFCNILSIIAHIILNSICIFDIANENVSCEMIFFNNVDSSIRKFCNIDIWAIEKCVRMNVVFEIYVEFYRVDLINDNLLSLLNYDKKIVKIYIEIAKKFVVAFVNENYNF